MIDPVILTFCPPHLPSVSHIAGMPNGIILCKKSNFMLSPDDKLQVMMLLKAFRDTLLKGELSTVDAGKFFTMLRCGIEAILLAAPNMEDSDAVRAEFNTAYTSLIKILDEMNERYTKIKAYRVSAESLKEIDKTIKIITNGIEYITVGEWYSGLHVVISGLNKVHAVKRKKRK